jgi:hypothetical protein
MLRMEIFKRQDGTDFSAALARMGPSLASTLEKPSAFFALHDLTLRSCGLVSNGE